MFATLNDMSATTDLMARVDARRELPTPEMRRALRKAAGASLAEVADAVGVTRQAVSMWELGQRSPRADYLETYLEILRAFRRVVAGPPESAKPAVAGSKASREPIRHAQTT